jgi:hypothetical protein
MYAVVKLFVVIRFSQFEFRPPITILFSFDKCFTPKIKNVIAIPFVRNEAAQSLKVRLNQFEITQKSILNRVGIEYNDMSSRQRERVSD